MMDVDAGECLCVIREGSGAVSSLALTPDRSRLAAAFGQISISIYCTATYERIASYAINNRPDKLCFINNSLLIVSSAHFPFIVIDIHTGQTKTASFDKSLIGGMVSTAEYTEPRVPSMRVKNESTETEELLPKRPKLAATDGVLDATPPLQQQIVAPSEFTIESLYSVWLLLRI